MKRLTLLLSCLPVLLGAETKVLVDAIPTGAQFAGATPFGLPFQDAGVRDPKEIEQGMAQAVASMVPAATQRGFSTICLLSVPGEDPVEVNIPAASAKLKLRRTRTAVAVVFYTGGKVAPVPTYSLAPLDEKKPHTSLKFSKVSVPPGVTTAGWVYFNLPRIQAEAIKAGAKEILLQAGGKGATSEVAIPGLKEPLLMPEVQANFTASWYTDPAAEARLRKERP